MVFANTKTGIPFANDRYSLFSFFHIVTCINGFTTSGDTRGCSALMMKEPYHLYAGETEGALGIRSIRVPSAETPNRL